jgi:hypothetical protein
MIEEPSNESCSPVAAGTLIHLHSEAVCYAAVWPREMQVIAKDVVAMFATNADFLPTMAACLINGAGLPRITCSRGE